MSSYSQSADQGLVFHGTDGIEAEEFIRSVINAAKAAGRLRDNTWIIDEVYAALSGDALRQYIELDDETRNDWLRLQRAIMQKYPPPSQRSLRGIGLSTTSFNALVSQPLSVPTPAAAAPTPSSFASMSASEKYFNIRAERQDSDKLLYVGIKSENVVLVTSRSEGVTVRHDHQTKQLRAIRMPGRTDTGEKFEIRRSETRVYFHSMAAVAKLQILDPQGIPKGQDPVLEGDSFTSWNVTDGNILQAIQEYASIYPIRLYVSPFDTKQHPDIKAYMDDPSSEGASSLKFLTLKLEEI